MSVHEIPQNIPSDFLTQQSNLILASYRRWTGKDLLQPRHLPMLDKTVQHRELFWAQFVLVTSNNAPDPILNYGNQQALELWEMSWETLTQTPGRQTAEPPHRDERKKFLDTVRKNGFIDNYSGVRISSSGKRFKIERATVWNLVDEDGNYVGQAAKFDSWKYL